MVERNVSGDWLKISGQVPVRSNRLQNIARAIQVWSAGWLKTHVPDQLEA